MIRNFDFILIASCLAAAFFSLPTMAKVDPFTFAFDCNKQTKLCAHGRLPKGHFAWLLAPEGTCKVVASEQFVFTDEGSSFPATRLIEKSKCPLTDSPSLLYLLTDLKNADFLTPAPTASTSLQNKISQLIKSENFLKKIIEDKEKSGPDTPVTKIKVLEASKPTHKVYSHPILKDMTIVSYLDANNQRGPTFAVINNKAIALTGACGAPGSLQTLVINDKAFLRIKNHWCSSDDSEEFIYELKDSQLELIYSNDEIYDGSEDL
jgi:hypothetical protein